ncbi:hypothetical protein PIB30_061649 [Stylosanthes scabra]|uniref:Uncharacterized protein n=1 Tax=Stylosanthes scabra TaxID=79078 RepID=A0ABU6ZJM9_9FABA|nr:hypothetical protein [Stylosanthes scabra]
MESTETLSKKADMGKEAVSGDKPMCWNNSGFDEAPPINMTGVWEDEGDIIMLGATFEMDFGKATQTPTSQPTPSNATGSALEGNLIRSPHGVRVELRPNLGRESVALETHMGITGLSLGGTFRLYRFLTIFPYGSQRPLGPNPSVKSGLCGLFHSILGICMTHKWMTPNLLISSGEIGFLIQIP